MRTDRSAGVPPRPSSIRMPSGVVKSTAMPGKSFQSLAHVRLDRLRGRGAIGLEDDQDVRHRVRHRIFGSLGPPGSSHDVLDFGHAPQDVLDPVIQAIDFVERGLGWQHRLQQERAFVELRHEVAADPEAQRDTAGTPRATVTSATILGWRRHDRAAVRTTA